jgi:hypothetical protein
LGQGECRAAEEPPQSRCLRHVILGVAAHAFRIFGEHLMHARAGNVLALRRGQAQVPGHRFEPMTGQVARSKVVPAHSVQRVDQFPPGYRVARAAHGVGAPALCERGTASRRPLLQTGLVVAPEPERNAQASRSFGQERQIEAVQIVILNHIRIERLNACTQSLQELGLRIVVIASADFNRFRVALRVTHGDQEHARRFRVQASGFEIELQPAHGVEWQAFEIGAAARDQVLLFRI